MTNEQLKESMQLQWECKKSIMKLYGGIACAPIVGAVVGVVVVVVWIIGR